MHVKKADRVYNWFLTELSQVVLNTHNNGAFFWSLLCLVRLVQCTMSLWPLSTVNWSVRIAKTREWSGLNSATMAVSVWLIKYARVVHAHECGTYFLLHNLEPEQVRVCIQLQRSINLFLNYCSSVHTLISDHKTNTLYAWMRSSVEKRIAGGTRSLDMTTAVLLIRSCRVFNMFQKWLCVEVTAA